MKKVLVLLATTIAVALLAWLAVTPGATASDPSSPDKTVEVRGGFGFKPNKIVFSDFHFQPGKIKVKSGATVEWEAEKNELDEPHTISIIDEADVPKTIAEVFECPVCGPFFEGHFPGGEGGPVEPVLNEGAAGLDTAGDSLFVDDGESVSAVISAPAGTTLRYICIFHPWMQGSIVVKGGPAEGDD